MEEYLGQVCRSRSKVKVTRSKDVSMGISSMISQMELPKCPKNQLPDITLRNTVTWGVFKVYVFFLKVGSIFAELPMGI